jgi:hypothetical protein
MPPKHNYIRRRKCLNESVIQVKSTLNFINQLLPTKVDPVGIDLFARQRVRKIEAACWNSHTDNMTDELYQTLLRDNTRQLCLALLAPHLAHENLPQASTVLRGLNLASVPVPVPAPRAFDPLPLPIINRPNAHLPDQGDIEFNMETAAFPSLDPFLEFSSNREQIDIFMDGDDYQPLSTAAGF